MKKILYALFSFIILTNSLYAFEPPLETHKKTVVALYNEIMNKKDFNAALKYIGTRYIQHNPMADDGTEGLKNYIQFLRDQYPHAKSEIKRVFAEGDYVILHVHATFEPNTRGLAIMDIFRLENDKIVEHWDVIQEVPEKSANDNGMF